MTTSRLPPGGRWKDQVRAAEAWPKGSSTAASRGTSPRARQSVIGPSSKIAAPQADDDGTATTRRSSSDSVAPEQAARASRATPPETLRNCAGGLTWNGRAATNSVPSRGALPVLRSR